MPKYHKIEIEGQGEIAFYGNIGALSQFEDITGKSIEETFQQGKPTKVSDILTLLYECHKIACIRLKKEPFEFELFKACSDEYLNVFADVMADIVEQIGGGEKKTKLRKEQ